jgi:hypothetical protein
MHIVGEENVGTTSTMLGGQRIFGTKFIALTRAVIFNQHTTSIMSWRWDIGSNFCIVTGLVLSGMGFPSEFFYRHQVLVHVQGLLSQLFKSHARILMLELLMMHPIRVKQICSQVVFGSIDILLRPALLSRLDVHRRDNDIFFIWDCIPEVEHRRQACASIESCQLQHKSRPGLFLRRRELRVHGGCVLGQLTKCHARIQSLELLSHGVLLEQVGAHVVLGEHLDLLLISYL